MQLSYSVIAILYNVLSELSISVFTTIDQSSGHKIMINLCLLSVDANFVRVCPSPK